MYNDNTYELQDYKTVGCAAGCSSCPNELLCPSNCPINQFLNAGVCTACLGTCDIVYGCRSALYCRLCKAKECLTCTSFSGPCTVCITNASISGTTCVCNPNAFWVQSSQTCGVCDILCDLCQTTDYWLCATCDSTTVSVNSLCLRACPYGFAAPCVTVTTPVISASFEVDFQATYGIFVTGAKSAQYQFFNTPEGIDPVPSKGRGFYFDGDSYLMSNINIHLSHSFSMGM